MSSYSRYETDLRRRLRDPERWPSFSTPVFADRLYRLALRSLSRGSPEGDLTAIVLFHQLAEQVLHLLIADSQFLVSVAALPVRVSFPPSPKRETFGAVLGRLQHGADFPGKARLIRLAGQLNEIRNGIAHKLLSRGSLSGLRTEAKRAHRLHEKLFTVFEAAHDDFRVAFHSYRKGLIA